MGTPPESMGRRDKEDLLQSHLPALRAYIRLNVPADVRAKESCSDLLQSACRQALQDLDQFEYRGEASFRAWLFRRALMTMLDKARYYRAEKRDKARERPLPTDGDLELFESYGDFATPTRHAMVREEIERVEQAFDELPDEYRRVITMSKIAELPHATIAADMGRTPKAIRNLLSRALARLGGVLARGQENDS